MQKIILIISLLVGVLGFSQQQTVSHTVTPSQFKETDNITITFDGATIDEAAWGLDDNALYLWAWSWDLDFSNQLDSPTNGTWTNSDEANRVTYDSGTDTYSISFVPSTFYDRTGIGRIGFLIKAKDGTGDKKSQDIIEDVLTNEITLTSPADNPVIADAGTIITISATTIFSSDFTLKANDVIVDTATGTTSYNYDYTLNEDTDFVLEADDGNQVLSVAFDGRITSLFPVPDGMLDGLNLDPNDDTKATLVFYAPDKATVHVIGDFNNWTQDDNFLMNKDTARDRFWIELTGLTPQFDHMYQYLVDSDIRVADPYSTIILDENDDQFIDGVTYPNLPAYPTGSTNHSVTLLRTGDPEYNWQITNFERPAKTDLVIYELLIRDFDELHSYDAVKARLDYLEDLGINAIELMPVNEFEGNLSWGYNPSFHMALDKYYGTQTAFKQFIDECHSRGIAVFLDVVYNHAAGQNPYYRMWNTDNGGYNGQPSADSPFFNETPTHAYNVFNDFNHSLQATQDYVKRTVQYWINEYKIDGFRWDLTKGFTQNCNDGDEGCTNGLNQDRIDILKEYADYQWEIDPEFYIIFEHLGGINEEKQWADYRVGEGKGIMLWNNQNHPYGQATIGKHDNGQSKFDGVSYVVKGFDGPSAVSYMESHDEQRLMFRNLDEGEIEGDYSVKDLKTALERMEMAGAFFFTVPGPKMIWQFGELGYEVDINFNGRTGEKPIRWEYLDEPDRMAVYNTWAKFIRLKKEVPIFKTTNFGINAGNAMGLKRIYLTLDSATGDDIKYITILGNFGLTTQEFDFEFQETGTWYDLLDNNTPHEITNIVPPIILEPGTFRIYADKPFIDDNDLDSDGIINAEDNCPGTPLGAIVDVNGCEVFTLPANNFALQINSESCRSSDNGSIDIVAMEALNYSVSIVGNGVNHSGDFTTDYTADNLAAGDYTVCITVDGQANYEQCFNVTITEPEDLNVFSRMSVGRGVVNLDLSGSELYFVTFNGTTIETTAESIELELKPGKNTISVEGEKICQGVYEDQIFFGSDIMAYPNPVSQGPLKLFLNISDKETATVNVYSILGNLMCSERTTKNHLEIDMSEYSKGIYVLNVITENETKSIKIIKN
jgi:glycosidase